MVKKNHAIILNQLLTGHFKQVRELLCTRGPAEIVSLPLIAAMGPKKFQLLYGFHSLSDDTLLETLGHTDYRANDDRIIRFVHNIVNKRLVEFQGVNGKSSQVAQTGIPGSEIIHGEAHTDGFELSKHVGSRLSLSHENGFG